MSAPVAPVATVPVAKAVKAATAAAAPAAPPKSAASSRKARKPKGETSRIKEFYKGYAKDPKHYSYTPEGNLRITLEGKPEEIIPLQPFRSLKSEEIDAIDKAKMELIEEVESEYEEALLKLRQSKEEYDRTGEGALNVVRLNTEVAELSLLRSATMYPLRWTEAIGSVERRRILLEQTHEVRKMPYEVYLFKHRPYAAKDILGHYRTDEEVAMGVMQGGAAETILIGEVDDEQTGIYHPAHENEFVFGETRFSSPYQAFVAARFRELGREEIRKQILGTRSARTIRVLAEKEPKTAMQPQELWKDILEAFYTQQVDSAKKLKDTGSSRFHFMEVALGGQVYADALVEVRSLLREKELDDASVGEVNEAVITEDEQKHAKKAAIMNVMRRRFQ